MSLMKEAREAFESQGGLDTLESLYNKELIVDKFLFMLDENDQPYFIVIDGDDFGMDGKL